MEPWWTRMMVTILPPADAVSFPGGVRRAISFASVKRSRVKPVSFAAGPTARFSRRSCWGDRAGHGRRTVFSGNCSAKSRPAFVECSELLVDQFTKVVSHYSSNALECQCRPALLAMKGVAHHHWTQPSRDDDDTVVAGGLLHSHPRSGPLPRCDTGLRATWPQAGHRGSYENSREEQGRLANSISRIAAPRQFLGMLHGNIHLEAVLQLGEIPTLSELICVPAPR